MTTPSFEISADHNTVWINGPEGLLARFGVRGIDVHRDGDCSGGFCTHTKTGLADWVTFKRKVAEIHGIEVSDQHMPARLRGH